MGSDVGTSEPELGSTEMPIAAKRSSPRKVTGSPKPLASNVPSEAGAVPSEG